MITLVLKEEKGNVANKKRFVDDFGGQTLFMPKTNPKPEDYSITFNGNVEDNFKIGMAITKKSIKVRIKNRNLLLLIVLIPMQNAMLIIKL